MFKNISKLFNDKNKDRIIEDLKYKVSSLSNELRGIIESNITKDDDYAKNVLEREIKIRELRNDIEQLEASIDHDKSESERYQEMCIEEGIEDGIKLAKKEFEANVKSLEGKLAKAVEDKFEIDGKYQGSLIVIKALEKQVEAGVKLADTLIDKIPDADVSITSPESINQTVNTGK